MGCSFSPNTELEKKEKQEVIFPAFKMLADSWGNKTHPRKTERSEHLEVFHSKWVGGLSGVGLYPLLHQGHHLGAC